MKTLKSRQLRGFTIVELLIVIVVIAILATISVMAYTGIQSRANNAVIEADANAIIKKLEMARVDLGHYPRTESEFPEGFTFSKGAYDTTQNNIYYCLDIANDKYAFGLRSKTPQSYEINNGVIVKASSISGHETCQLIGRDAWVDDSITWTKHGYDFASSSWKSDWSWTK